MAGLALVLPCSPEAMISELRRWPGVSTLEDLKECLDFSSKAWASLYCQLHGAELLLEVRQCGRVPTWRLRGPALLHAAMARWRRPTPAAMDS